MSVPDDRPPELDLDAPYSLGEPAFAALVEDLKALDPHQLVEFGSGASSVRLAQALPGTRILSLEHAPEFYRATRALVARFGPLPNLRVELRPLTWQAFGPLLYWTYAKGEFPAQVDAVLIDGPPYWTQRGREGCLHQVVSSLRPGGRIYLDDAQREAEQQAALNWQATYPQLESRDRIGPEGRVLVLELSAAAERAFPRSVLRDNAGTSLRLLRWRTSARLKRMVRRSA